MPLTAVILSNFLFSDIVFFFTVFTGICSGSYFAVVTLHIIQDNVLEFFHDALAAQGDDFFAIDKHRRGRRFASAGQADADVGMLRFTGAVESKHANIGISLPGTGESPAAPVFVDGEKVVTLRGERIVEEFQDIVLNYVKSHYGKVAA